MGTRGFLVQKAFSYDTCNSIEDLAVVGYIYGIISGDVVINHLTMDDLIAFRDVVTEFIDSEEKVKKEVKKEEKKEEKKESVKDAFEILYCPEYDLYFRINKNLAPKYFDLVKSYLKSIKEKDKALFRKRRKTFNLIPISPDSDEYNEATTGRMCPCVSLTNDKKGGEE